MAKTIAKMIVIGSALTLLFGCAAQRTGLTPSLRLIDVAPVGSIHRKELGDTLVSKGRVFSYDGIQLHNRIEGGDGFFIKKLIIEPQSLVARQMDDDWTYHFAQNFQVYDALIGSVPGIGGLRVSLADKNNLEIFSSLGLNLSPRPQPEITFTKITAVDRPSFTQELIYNGRIGANVRFLYREFSNDHIRGPFSQEVQYDMSDGQTIGFKGARIEIIEATNTFIEYKLLSNFPESQ
jgi:hypothetical protein